MVVSEQQLLGRAQHPAGLVTGDVEILDQLAVRHSGAGQRHRYQRTRDRVRGAGDDLLHAVPEVDLVHPQRVARLGVRNLFEHLPHHDLGEVDDVQRFDLEPKASEHFGRVFGPDAVQVDEVRQPFVTDAH